MPAVAAVAVLQRFALPEMVDMLYGLGEREPANKGILGSFRL